MFSCEILRTTYLWESFYQRYMPFTIYIYRAFYSWHMHSTRYYHSLWIIEEQPSVIKLQPAIFPLSQHIIHFHELPADTMQRFLQ